jgi:ketosteroid isomerase-like protein
MIAHNPLHGSGGAELPHPALALGDDAHAAQGIGMTDSRRRQPAVDEAPHTIPKDAAGDKVGYAYTLEHMSGKQKNGQAVDFWGRCTSGFQKINGKRLDMHDHCSVPTDFETGKPRST